MRKENLPQEIDELIWLTAESNDESAIKDFEERYPQYRAELATRRVMIEVMRKSKPQGIPMHLENPRMYLSKSRNSWFRWAFVPISVMMLTVLAFGTYILKLQLSKEKDILNKEEDNFILESLPKNKNSMNPIIVPGNRTQERTDSYTAITPDGTSPRPMPENNQPQGIILKVGKTTLFDVLNSISRQGNIPIHFAPNIENISLDIQAPPGVTTLTLSLQEAITAIERSAPIRILDNGPEGILILPIDQVRNIGVDEGSQTPPHRTENQGGPSRAPTSGNNDL